MRRACDYGSIGCLSEAEDVAAVQACAQLAPGQAAVAADEDAAPLLIVDYANVNRPLMLYVLHIGDDLPG